MWTLTEPVAPCPFCNSTVIVALDVGAGGGLLQCCTCQAQGPIGRTHEAAVRGWQTRGRLAPRPCLWCATLYQPRSVLHQYCHPDCRYAAARHARVEEHQAALKDQRLRNQQEARLHKQMLKWQAAFLRQEEARQQEREEAWRQWALAVS